MNSARRVVKRSASHQGAPVRPRAQGPSRDSGEGVGLPARRNGSKCSRVRVVVGSSVIVADIEEGRSPSSSDDGASKNPIDGSKFPSRRDGQSSLRGTAWRIRSVCTGTAVAAKAMRQRCSSPEFGESARDRLPRRHESNILRAGRQSSMALVARGRVRMRVRTKGGDP